MKRSVRFIVLLALMLFCACASVLAEVTVPEAKQTGLEMVYINTDGGALPTCDVVSAPAGFSGRSVNNCTQVSGQIIINERLIRGMKMQITGDALALNDKKPLLLTFAEPQDLLLEGKAHADTEWLLTYDETPLRTVIGLKMSELVGMPWTSGYRQVNLVVNGDYWGVYLLMETEKRSATREATDDDGLIIDHDLYWWNQKQVMMSYNGCEYTPVFPSVLSDSMMEVGRRLVDTLETSISNGTYDRVIETTSFARWLLAHELLGTSGGRPKIYFKRKNNEAKLEMGSLRGFEHIMQADDAWSGLHKDIYHFNLLFNGNNKRFLKTFCSMWHAEGAALCDSLDAWLAEFAESDEAAVLEKAYRLDAEQWGRQKQSVPALTTKAREWFAHRREWLDQNIGDPYAYDDLGTVEQLGLPVVTIETVGGEEPTCDYEEQPSGMAIKNRTAARGRMRIVEGGQTIYDSGDYEDDRSGLTFKIRGNSTAWLSKKPYKLKLQQKADLIGLIDGADENRSPLYLPTTVSALNEDKDWIMLKMKDNFINTPLGLMVNDGVGLQWTPRCRFVNLMINGEYRGLYCLIESVKRSRGRLNVDYDGFIVEDDIFWWNEPTYFKANDGNHYTFTFPDADEVSTEQKEYARRCINELDKSIDDGTYDQVADLESLVAWLLAHDILGSSDPFGSNIFITKKDSKESSKLTMGNLWDFDWVMRIPKSWSYEHTMLSNCIRLLHNSNKQYVRRYREQWESVGLPLVDTLAAIVDSFAVSDEAQAIQRSLDVDYNTWEKCGYHVSTITASAKKWFTRRKEWMSDAVAQMEQETDTATYVNAGLPILYIKTEDYSEPSFAYADAKFFTDPSAAVDTLVVGSSTTSPGTVLLGDNGGTMRLQLTVGERVEQGKKPYTIIMDRAADLLAEEGAEEQKQREWTLLNTPSRLNDLIGWQTGDAVGMEWTPRCQYVNVIINGDYRGVYLLAEKPDRADSATQRQIDAMNEVLRSGKVQTAIDAKSFARWLIAHDLLGSGDYHKAQTLYSCGDDGLIRLGPLWGFTDMMSGANQYSSQHRDQPQFVSLFANSDKYFARIYKEVWEELQTTILSDLLGRIDSFAQSSQAAGLQRSVALDNSRWGKSSLSVAEEVERARQWFTQRVAWLQQSMGSVDTGFDTSAYDSLSIDVMFVNRDGATADIALRRNGYTYYSSTATITEAADADSTLRIETASQADLLQTGVADNRWLLSQEAESLNTLIGQTVSRLIGHPWTPALKFVLLVENGESRGLRLLSQPVTACIQPLGISTDEGFIVENDNERYSDYASRWTTSMGEHYHYWLPEEPSEQMADWVKLFALDVEWQQTQARYPELIDVESYASWALAHDLLGTGQTPTSGVFFVKRDTTASTRLSIGPLRGFRTIMQTDGEWAAPHEGYDYIRRMFNNLHREFVEAYKSRWAAVSATIYDDICGALDQFASEAEATTIDQLRHADSPTVAEEISAAKTWFARRIDWLNSAAASLWTTLSGIETKVGDAPGSDKQYDTQGRPTTETSRGIVVSKGQKVFRK